MKKLFELLIEIVSIGVFAALAMFLISEASACGYEPHETLTIECRGCE